MDAEHFEDAARAKLASKSSLDQLLQYDSLAGQQILQTPEDVCT